MQSIWGGSDVEPVELRITTHERYGNHYVALRSDADAETAAVITGAMAEAAGGQQIADGEARVSRASFHQHNRWLPFTSFVALMLTRAPRVSVMLDGRNIRSNDESVLTRPDLYEPQAFRHVSAVPRAAFTHATLMVSEVLQAASSERLHPEDVAARMRAWLESSIRLGEEGTSMPAVRRRIDFLLRNDPSDGEFLVRELAVSVAHLRSGRPFEELLSPDVFEPFRPSRAGYYEHRCSPRSQHELIWASGSTETSDWLRIDTGVSTVVNGAPDARSELEEVLVRATDSAVIVTDRVSSPGRITLEVNPSNFDERTTPRFALVASVLVAGCPDMQLLDRVHLDTSRRPSFGITGPSMSHGQGRGKPLDRGALAASVTSMLGGQLAAHGAYSGASVHRLAVSNRVVYEVSALLQEMAQAIGRPLAEATLLPGGTLQPIFRMVRVASMRSPRRSVGQPLTPSPLAAPISQRGSSTTSTTRSPG